MAQPHNTKRLSEVEYCLDCYFNTYFVPVMKHERAVLQSAQAKEVAEYSNSLAGIMHTLASASSSAGMLEADNTMLHLRLIGKECSKTAEDYVGMCKDNILGNKEFVADLHRLVGEENGATRWWRKWGASVTTSFPRHSARTWHSPTWITASSR